MSRPTISVVTVCFNSARTIEETIRSVLAQTWPAVEYIVVDGGSTDGTLDIVRRHERRIARWISEPDRGIYDAMNKGVQAATGEWIHLLNSDDVYADPGVLVRVAPRLDPERTNYCDITRDFGGGRTQRQSFPFDRRKLMFSAYLPHPGLIVHRAQYERVGLYDTRLKIAADHDMILRLLAAYPPNHIPEVLVRMRQDGASAQAPGIVLREFRDVSIRHGVPRALAWLFYSFKRLYWSAAR